MEETNYKKIFRELDMSEKEVENLSSSLRKGRLTRHILDTLLTNEVPQHARSPQSDKYFIENVAEGLRQEGINAEAVMKEAVEYASGRDKLLECMNPEKGPYIALAHTLSDYFKIRNK